MGFENEEAEILDEMVKSFKLRPKSLAAAWVKYRIQEYEDKRPEFVILDFKPC